MAKRTTWDEIKASQPRTEEGRVAFEDEARITAFRGAVTGSVPRLDLPKRTWQTGWGPPSRLSPAWRRRRPADARDPREAHVGRRGGTGGRRRREPL